MQVLTGLVVIFGFFLEIWDPTTGIEVCEENHPVNLNGVNICANPARSQESLQMNCTNESIVIKDIFIGSKVEVATCKKDAITMDPTEKERCCRYHPSDLLFDSKCPGIQNATGPLSHYLYSDTITSCSGQRYCDKKLTYVIPLPKESSHREFADYVRVFYDCVPDTASIGFCESRSITGHTVSLRYDETTADDSDEKTLHDCSCQVTSSGSEPIKITALDIRLQDKTDDMECHYTKLSVVDAKNKNQIFRNIFCLDKEFIFGVPVLNTTGSRDIRISLGPIKKKDYPSFVWLQIAGTSNRTRVTVTCNGPTTEKSNGTLPEAIVIAIISAVILTGIIVTIVALCKKRQHREYNPPQPENIYFELETPEEKYDQIQLKQLQGSEPIKPDPSYGRLNYGNPEESHYAEPDKLNGKTPPYLIDNDYATPDSCRS
ncbi:uncharacterized protein LOC124119986 [Haliotis rufescens]|uniref:uncharacterized protein LOC124119986 n=1 Tax=Haliotis rufescens TaxID=6454 RepID=UPI001EB05DC0|nr:uncharacterized protein LOC124119986 [Haliotis rufescens]